MSIESRSRKYGQVFNHWQITDFLGSGSGGKSAVFRLIHTDPNSSVQSALKVISLIEKRGCFENLTDNRKNDYLRVKTSCKELAAREVLLMNELQGRTNIVAYLDHEFIDWEDEYGFGCDMLIRMELLTDLRSKIEQDHIFSESEVLKIGKDICSALILCHKKNILHRDIKPENIFFNSDGNYKLGDFGVSRIISSAPMSKASTGVCTPEYAAPEQLSGNYDIRVDIYSLGLVLYELTNGNLLPFATSSFVSEREIQERISGKPLPNPSNASKDLAAVIQKACAFRNEDRYQSAEAFWNALNSISEDPLQNVEIVAVPGATQNVSGREKNDRTTQYASGGQKKNQENGKNPDKGSRITQYAGDGTSTNSARQTVKAKGEKEMQSTSSISNIVKATLIGIVILLILLMLKFCEGEPGVQTDPSDSIGETTTAPIETQPTETLPIQADWSEWLDELPSYVTPEYYDIEEQTLYSTSALERTTSTETDTMEGWELYDTVEADGGYSPPSAWSRTPVEETATRKVESKLFYAYRTKETTTGTSPEKSGWTLYDTTYKWGEYGPSSGWSKNKVTASDSRKVETKTQYAYRDKEYTTSSDSSLSGWTLYDTTYGAWGNAQTTSKKPKESNTLRITSTKQTGWGYYHWCNYYYNGGTNWNVDSIKYGDQTAWESMWHGYTSSFELPAISCADKGGQQAYGGSGNGAQACLMGFYYWFRNPGEDTYSYTYETRTPTYHYYRWPEQYSNWSDAPISASNDREVITQTLYSYRDREQIPTYHFYRYGSLSEWSEDKINDTDTRKVETERRYRYSDLITETTYCFQRWTEPTEYLPTPAIASDELRVETKTQYRFKSKDLRNPYTDISSDASYYEPVMWVTEQGIMNGISDTTFDPNGIVTRGQMVTMLWRSVGEPEPVATESAFGDVGADSPYLKAVLWATEQGIASGKSADAFGVDTVCTHAQVITFMYRTKGSPEISLAQEPFSDVESGAFYYDAVRWAYENAISSGVSTTEFGVNNECNRAQVAVMLYRTFSE